MEENIYQPPSAELATRDTHKGSPIKAVAISAVVDIGGTTLLGIVMGIVYSAVMAANGMSTEEIVKEISAQDKFSNFSIFGMVLGSVISIYAGYLCAKIVNYNEYRFVAILGVVLIIFSLLISGSYYSTIENLFFSVLSIGCVYLGAWLYVSNKNKQITRSKGQST